MKHYLSILLLSLLSTLCTAQNLVNIDSRGIILDGYDVVELCKKNEVPGSYKYTAEYNGATYQFSSQENLRTFEKNPSQYAPEYGGHCAVSTSMGKLEPGHVSTWSVVNLSLIHI